MVDLGYHDFPRLVKPLIESEFYRKSLNREEKINAFGFLKDIYKEDRKDGGNRMQMYLDAVKNIKRLGTNAKRFITGTSNRLRNSLGLEGEICGEEYKDEVISPEKSLL